MLHGTNRRRLAFLLMSMASIGPGQIFAGGFSPFILDPANLGQAVARVGQQAQQITKQVQDYQVQFAKTQKLINDARGFNINSLLAKASPEAAKLLADLEKGKGQINDMQRSLQSLQQRVDSRRVSAQQAGKTLEGWYAYLKQQRDEGNKSAALAIQEDQRVIQRSTNLMKQVQDIATNIPAMKDTSGGSLQNLSASLNVLIASNAELLRMTSMSAAAARGAAQEGGAIVEDRRMQISEHIREQQKRDSVVPKKVDK